MLIPYESVVRAVSEFGTPVFLADIGRFREELAAFREAFPGARTFYSTKTNPHPIFVDAAIALGMEFDAASSAELEMLIDRGVAPADIVFTHPHKTDTEVTSAYGLGIRGFVFDSYTDVVKLSALAPSADLYLRLAVTQHDSVYDYRGRFGATIGEARSILMAAVECGYSVAGITFHVGTQTLSVRAWQEAMHLCGSLLDEFEERISTLRRVNIGCGVPFDYGRTGLVDAPAVAAAIHDHLERRARKIEIATEPGRPLLAPAMVLVARVEHIVVRDARRWVSVDASVYQGMTEVLQSQRRVQFGICALDSSKSGNDDIRPTSLCTVVGKTLDPDDILAEDVVLPLALVEGDLLVVRDVGAYSVPFITDYHALPRPAIASVDSADDDRVVLGSTPQTDWGVYGRRAFAKDEKVMSILGYRTRDRTRSTVQIAAGAHVEPTVVARHLNHSCDPNAGVRTRTDGFLDVIAMRPIAAGEQIVVDYAMFETEVGVASMVACACMAVECRGAIQGYRELSANQRVKYRGYLASHLLGPAESACAR